ncbi:MAG TPA: filamentous hemagglutinin N-terminal domain-containing protein, partial [Planctomycetaceae bacterium]|nr:filamentous hemagglutinin N-terminal domain-containing protein [Planctomycetaceae bacterium]
MVFPPSFALANPIDGTVVQGSATVSQQGNTVTVNQSTPKAVINWQGFSIAAGEKTVFNMPNSSSAVLNRVVGGDPSAIYGSIQSNGNVYLVNPNGIFVGPGAMINTNSFIASTSNISDENFMQGGDLRFQGDSRNSVINYGTIEALEGDIYLIGASVENHGALNAPNGTVGLGAGLDATIVDSAHPSLVVRATQESLSNVGILNTGSINALQAELIANGSNAFGLAINNTGTIRATGYEERGGRIFLVADGGKIQSSGELVAKRGENGGDVIGFAGGEEETSINISGLVDVSGKDQGGTVYLKAGSIDIAKAEIRVGGTIGGQLLLSVGPHTVNLFEGEANGNYLKTDGSSTVVIARDATDTNILKITTVDGEGSLDPGGSGSNIVSGEHDDGFSGFVIESADASNPYLTNIEFNLDSVGNLPNEGDVSGSTVVFTVYVLEPDGVTETANTFTMSYQQFLDLQSKDGGDTSSSRVLLEAVNGELIQKITVESILLNDDGNPIDLDGNVVTDGSTVNFLNQIKQINSVELVVEDPSILTIRKFVVGDDSQSFAFYLN